MPLSELAPTLAVLPSTHSDKLNKSELAGAGQVQAGKLQLSAACAFNNTLLAPLQLNNISMQIFFIFTPH
jgi:hypothetical protein